MQLRRRSVLVARTACAWISLSAPWLIAPAVIMLLFASVLAGVDRLAFRDIGHFYTPLFDYVAERNTTALFPLWNPLDQTGIPLAGETSTAIFYPLRILIFSVFDTEMAIGWYVVVHLWIASLAAQFAALMSGAKRRGAVIASLIYPLSGSVLFLFTNPPFLVGAAWMPFALTPLVSMQHGSPIRRSVIAGAALAMMVLGGDPQTALHVVLCAGLIVVVGGCLGVIVKRTTVSRWGENVTVLIGCGLLAAALAMPQLAASISWSRQSDRVGGGDNTSVFDKPKPDSRQEIAFQYSLAPWHIVELATPAAFGSLLPTFRRMSVLIPDEDRMWTPTIYCGLFACVALLMRLRHLRRDGVDAWLAIGIIGMLAAWGRFGPVWFVQWTGFADTVAIERTDGAVGGLYWALFHFLPGYDAFRYPAKWLPFVSIAVAVIAGQSLDKIALRRAVVSSTVIKCVAAGFVVAVLFIGALQLRPTSLIDNPARLPSDEFWGPLDLRRGLQEVQWSLAQSLAVFTSLVLVIRFRRPLVRKCGTRAVFALIVLFVSVDLALSSVRMIARVPMNATNELANSQPTRRSSGNGYVDGERWMRVQSGAGWPIVWRAIRDPDRLIDVAASGQASWFGRWHLAQRQNVLNNMVSIQSRATTDFYAAARRATKGMTSPDRDRFWYSMRRWLGLSGVMFVSTSSQTHFDGERTAILVDAELRREAGFDPSVRIDHDWTHRAADHLGINHFAEMLTKIHLQKRNAIPEVTRSAQVPTPQSTSRANANVMQVAQPNPETSIVRITSSSRCLVSRPVYQDGHWLAEYRSDQDQSWHTTPVYQVGYLQQGVIVPPGELEIRFRYAPWWFGPSIALWILSWLILLGWSIASRFRARNLFVSRWVE